ncbi:hypothetical protein HYN69_00010 [Gemmobacter aquarius]|uniref:PASTA domain-containing protein n=1 Tax=Paragemmobacter aquarius TaxID=2169400 RepID=A0A2S0UH12_9RHOB|nr:hypothetical protein [Gemmobacter aquarius]AWB47112.1 hypothetical protein HYN69_00010 [Gemmobacter aquarius]
MRMIVAGLVMLAASPATAALSGFYDSAEKIATILGSEAVADALRQAPVGAITNTGTTKDGADEWTVRTQDCDLVVALTAQPLPEGMVGKATYDLRIATPCE